jgi:hypothetical protein
VNPRDGNEISELEEPWRRPESQPPPFPHGARTTTNDALTGAPVSSCDMTSHRIATESATSSCSAFPCRCSECVQSNNAAPRTQVSLPPYVTPLPDSILGEDFEYLRAKGALTIPDIPLRNQLLQSFIEYVYPFLPLVNLEELLSIVQAGNGSQGQVSLLVFQAIMLAGSGFVEMSYLKAAGFQTRRSALRALFQKVKVSFRTRTTLCS